MLDSGCLFNLDIAIFYLITEQDLAALTSRMSELLITLLSINTVIVAMK